MEIRLSNSLPNLLESIQACTLCAPAIEPRPVVQAGAAAAILVIGQAPGRKVHASGVPWDDVSGRRLRTWLGVDDATFYDPEVFALVPMGFCFPGSGKSGDLPPRPECYDAWHEPLLRALPAVRLTLLLGMYAQERYLERAGTVTEQVSRWRDDLERGLLALPHPSPRSRWVRQNPWFEAEVLPVVRRVVADAVSPAPQARE